MTKDIEIPDIQRAVREALDTIEVAMSRAGSHGWAEHLIRAARRLRADAEEIARLTAERDKAIKNAEEFERDWLEAVDQCKPAPDPLTRIAAALERPSREWVAALTLVGAARDCPTYESTVTSAFKFADALLVEMGEG